MAGVGVATVVAEEEAMAEVAAAVGVAAGTSGLEIGK